MPRRAPIDVRYEDDAMILTIKRSYYALQAVVSTALGVWIVYLVATRPINIASIIFAPFALIFLAIGGLLLYHSVLRRSTAVFDRRRNRITLSEGHEVAIDEVRHVGVHRREYMNAPHRRWNVELVAKHTTLTVITGLDRERAREIAQLISQYLHLHTKEY